MTASKRSLKGKTALITGAAKRLGREITIALSAMGVNTVIHYHKSDHQAKQLAQQIHTNNSKTFLIQADLSNSKQSQQLMQRAIAMAGPINILINNASVFPSDTIWDTTDLNLHQNMQIHAYTALYLSREFAQQHINGHIINMLDSRVNDYDREHLAYHLSKRALQSITRIMALELAPNIQVNAIAPGLILAPPKTSDQYLKDMAHTNPLHTHGSADDINNAVIFLLQSKFITGQTLYIDGGRHIKGRIYE